MQSGTLTGSLSGDTSKIELFGKRIERAGTRASLTGLSKEIGNAALFQVQLGFSQQRDPYGVPWAKKVIPDGNPILRGKTGKLRVGWYLKYSGPDAAIIGNRQNYAKFQLGTGIYGPTGQPITPKKRKALSFKVGNGRFTFRSVRGAPPRLMTPRQGDMPPTWNRSITTAAREYMLARLAEK